MHMPIEHKYSIGDTVRYRSDFGRGSIKTATIISDDASKNYAPIYDLDNGYWCYENQIIGYGVVTEL